ncbi:MAG: hypothetical protein AABZ53_14330 [Planctomycetota bacterium]
MAAVFILGGVLAALEVLVALVAGRLSLNFGVLGLFIGPGLLRFSPGWRLCALVCIWIGIVGLLLAGACFLGNPDRLTVTIFFIPAGQASPALALGMCAFCLLIAVWQYRVLTRPDIRVLFDAKSLDVH